jgi:hypothetical protein
MPQHHNLVERHVYVPAHVYVTRTPEKVNPDCFRRTGGPKPPWKVKWMQSDPMTLEVRCPCCLAWTTVRCREASLRPASESGRLACYACHETSALTEGHKEVLKEFLKLREQREREWMRCQWDVAKVNALVQAKVAGQREQERIQEQHSRSGTGGRSGRWTGPSAP